MDTITIVLVKNREIQKLCFDGEIGNLEYLSIPTIIPIIHFTINNKNSWSLRKKN